MVSYFFTTVNSFNTMQLLRTYSSVHHVLYVSSAYFPFTHLTGHSLGITGLGGMQSFGEIFYFVNSQREVHVMIFLPILPDFGEVGS